MPSGDLQPTQQPLGPGQIAGIVIAVVIFVLLHLIFCPLIIGCLYLRIAHSKKTNSDGQIIPSSNVDMQSAFHQIPHSNGETFDTTNPPTTEPGTRALLKSQQNDRQQFLERKVCTLT